MWKNTILAIMLVLTSTIGCSSEPPEDRSSKQPYDFTYDSYAQLLANHVENGLVDYSSLKSNHARLDSLVAAIGNAGLAEATRTERLAFYINAYNILTLKSVVDNYPVESIKDIDGVWNDHTWSVAGQRLTLNEIEHEILRKEFEEPRIHVAINCAAYSCPALSDTPYRPEHLDSMLTAASQGFARSDRYNRIDASAGEVKLSAIFDWFGEDFVPKYYVENLFPGLEKNKAAALAYIMQHLGEETARELKSKTSLGVEYLEYDWSLNDQNR